MKEIMAVIRPERIGAVKAALAAAGVPAIRHRRVLGRGRQGGLKYLSKAHDRAAMKFLPKRLVSVVVADADVEPAVKAILSAARTGSIGDGVVWLLPVERAVSIRTGADEDFGRPAGRTEAA